MLGLLAPALLMAAAYACAAAPPGPVVDRYGAIVRGDPAVKRLALCFTGDQFGESAKPILDALRERKFQGSFFITGAFLKNPSLQTAVRRMIDEGHYVGPHSHGHLLYAPWEKRETSLVTQEQFTADLKLNLDALRRAGALADGRPLYFIPPYEWYNAQHVAWAKAAGATLVNFTPGTGSNRDYAPEGDARFVPSSQIYDDILAYEVKTPEGLNGFLLLLHLGSGRRDPFHPLLGKLCDELSRRGYAFVRVDELLAENRP
jgi:peptidoglycan/xylan/chitin deacetylase (PgdA/CDA1 family)